MKDIITHYRARQLRQREGASFREIANRFTQESSLSSGASRTRVRKALRDAPRGWMRRDP